MLELGSHIAGTQSHVGLTWNKAYSVANQCREMIFLLWNDIELSWKLHLLEHFFQIFTYKYGIVVTF